MIQLSHEIFLIQHSEVFGTISLNRVGVVLNMLDPWLESLDHIPAVLHLVEVVDVLDIEVGLGEGSELTLFETYPKPKMENCRKFCGLISYLAYISHFPIIRMR